MRTLSPAGQRVVAELAQRHGFSADAAASLLGALHDGRGSMAQFDHREFGGLGQWMQGGMTMVSDLRDADLRRRVDALACDLAAALARDPGLVVSVQKRAQGWWPAALGVPASTGAQDGVRYAYFPDRRRLAIELNGAVKVYDTLDHRISGFAQQQGGGARLAFTSQHGVVNVALLPEANADGLD
jgi:hypothetical protein